MADQYVNLGFSTVDRRNGFCGRRWPQSITQFQPQLDGRHVQQIVGARIAFQVLFNEFAPAYQAQLLESVNVKVLREVDGELFFEAEYDFTYTE
jgi:hypothetical protein